MAQTQMALDSLDFDGTVALATKVAPHVDIFHMYHDHLSLLISDKFDKLLLLHYDQYIYYLVIPTVFNIKSVYSE